MRDLTGALYMPLTGAMPTKLDRVGSYIATHKEPIRWWETQDDWDPH